MTLRILVALAAVILTLVAGEIIVRLALPGGTGGVTLEVAPERVEGVPFWVHGGAAEDGFFRTEGLDEANDDAPTLLLLGDSIPYGVELPPEARVGAHLSARWRVLDAAVPGHSLAQERIALTKTLAVTHPDAIVLFVFSLALMFTQGFNPFLYFQF